MVGDGGDVARLAGDGRFTVENRDFVTQPITCFQRKCITAPKRARVEPGQVLLRDKQSYVLIRCSPSTLSLDF